MLVDEQKIGELVALIRREFPNWNGFSDSGFVEEEIEYKQATVSKAREMLSEQELRRLIDECQFDEFLDRIKTIGKDNNL